MESTPHIAIVDDHKDIRELVGRYLGQHGCRVSAADSAATLRHLLQRSAPDLVVNAQVHGCTLRGNGRSGVSVGGVSQLSINGCLVGDNGHSQLRSEGQGKLTIENCDVIEQEGRLSIDHQGGLVERDGKSIRR